VLTFCIYDALGFRSSTVSFCHIRPRMVQHVSRLEVIKRQKSDSLISCHVRQGKRVFDSSCCCLTCKVPTRPVVGFTSNPPSEVRTQSTPILCAHFKRFSLHADWAGHRPPSKRTAHCTCGCCSFTHHALPTMHPPFVRAEVHQALPLRGSSQGHHAFQRWRSSQRQDSKSSRTSSLLVHAGITDSISPVRQELRFHSITACRRARPVTRKSAICS
jgi:hypothetical protein